MDLIECAPNNNIEYDYQFQQNHPLVDFAKNNLRQQGILLKGVGRNTEISESAFTERVNNPLPYYYLKIDDDFIHKLFPLIPDNTLEKPDYFSFQNSVGAHISFIYPEEITNIFSISELNQIFSFDITGLVDIKVFGKRIIALVVESKELENLRTKYGFAQKLKFHGLLVPFHITVAIARSYPVANDLQ